jgi:hypothetical protein
MDEYFLAEKAVEILLENLNDHFVKCLINISIKDKYTSNIRLIIGIVELIKGYLNMRRNDILSSCIKYSNKSYYIHLCDSLFRLLHNHLVSNESTEMNENKYVFIKDLIDKYNNPIVPVPANPISISTQASCKITRNFKDGSRNRFNSSIYSDEADEAEFVYNEYVADTTANITKDAGTLFKEAYNLRKQHRTANNNSGMKDKDKDIELEEIKINQNSNDLL